MTTRWDFRTVDRIWEIFFDERLNEVQVDGHTVDAVSEFTTFGVSIYFRIDSWDCDLRVTGNENTGLVRTLWIEDRKIRPLN